MTTKAIRVPQAVKEMGQPLRAVYDDIIKKVNTATAKTGELQYDIGTKVQQVMEDPDKYDTQAVQKLSEALGGEFTPSTLRAYARVSAVFARDEVLQALGVNTATGRRLTFSHFGALSAVTKKGDRARLMKQAVTEGLTVKQLMAKVRELLGVRSSGGRPVIAPATPKAGLTQISALAGSFTTRADDWEKSIFKPLSAEKTITPQMRELVVSAKEHVEALLSRLELAQNRLDGLLAATAEEETEEEEVETTPAKRGNRNAAAEAEDEDEDEEDDDYEEDLDDEDDDLDDEDLEDEEDEDEEDEDEEAVLPSQRQRERRGAFR